MGAAPHAGGGPIAVDPAALSSLSGMLRREGTEIGQMATSTPLAPSGNPALDGVLSGFDSHLRTMVGALSEAVSAVGGLVATAAASYPATDNRVGQSMHRAR